MPIWGGCKQVEGLGSRSHFSEVGPLPVSDVHRLSSSPGISGYLPIAIWINTLGSPLLLMSVISTDSEGAKRPKGSGEIPRVRPLPYRYEVFSPSCSCYPLPDARTDSTTSFGSTFSRAAPARFTRVSPAFSRVAFISISMTPSRASPRNTSAIAWCTTKATRTWKLPSGERSRSNAGAGRRRSL